MCGLFGAIGQNINPGIIRALAIANRSRGAEGIGFFDSSGKMIKSGKDSTTALAYSDFNDFIGHSRRWFLAGHTRAATRGKVSKRNAHPFRYGSVIGAHNGIVSAPAKYAVDSEYLIDLLAEHSSDYQTALGEVSGYWGLTWFDGDAFYMQGHENVIAIGRDASGTYYYSSDGAHLRAASGIADISEVRDGCTIRFRAGCAEYDILPALVNTGGYVKFDYRTVGNSKSGKTTKYDFKTEYTWAKKSDSAERYTWTKQDEWDKLAWDMGYTDLQDVKERESLRTLDEAKDFLEGAIVDGFDEYRRDFN